MACVKHILKDDLKFYFCDLELRFPKTDVWSRVHPQLRKWTKGEKAFSETLSTCMYYKLSNEVSM